MPYFVAFLKFCPSNCQRKCRDHTPTWHLLVGNDCHNHVTITIPHISPLPCFYPVLACRKGGVFAGLYYMNHDLLHAWYKLIAVVIDMICLAANICHLKVSQDLHLVLHSQPASYTWEGESLVECYTLNCSSAGPIRLQFSVLPWSHVINKLCLWGKYC